MASAREVVERGNEAFNKHDVEALIDLYAPDAEFKGPGGMVFTTREAIGEFTRGWFQGFPDCKLRVLSYVVTDDAVVEEGVFEGTHTGVFPTPMGDIPPTGRRVEGGYTDIFRVRDGKIVSDHLSFDRMELMEQLGLVPQAATV